MLLLPRRIYIYIYRNVKFLESEDELAFVLAHEIGHIELDHGLNAVIQKTSGDLFKKGAGGMGVSDSFFGGMIDFAENGYSKDLKWKRMEEELY